MKKLFLFIFIILFSINLLSARNIYEKELPLKFKSECFEFSGSYDFSPKNEGKYKIKTDREDVIAVKWNYLIPIINYKKLWKKYNYNTSQFKKNIFLNDDNLKTQLNLDVEKNKEIILQFDKKVLANSFKLNFKHSAENYVPEIFISEDWKKYSLVSFSKLSDFNFNYFKIIFEARDEKDIKKEIIKISELSFSKTEKVKLIKVDWWGEVNFYSNYNCEDYINLDTIPVPFEINSNTSLIEINLEKNKSYNPNIEIDVDLDKINNSEDNCPKIFNPLQKDSNWNWIWDKCSDVDWDGILWYLDNCPETKNKDQKDLNLNKIWDACEFDKDKDEIYDSVDNCINVKNPFQKDSDKDGVGDKCDNCEYFNPSQLDKNKNWIWDKCDLRINVLGKNDDDKDGILNSSDNCPNVHNPEQKDWDNDWIWNSCDNCLFLKNNDQLDFDKNNIWDFCEDSDRDWIDWIKDNCVNLFNKDQKDSDNNWIWDSCEDKDLDEIWFAIDNCPHVYNPFQKDLDKDWIWDKCDNEDNRLIKTNKNISTFIFFTITLIIIILAFYFINRKKKLFNKDKENLIKEDVQNKEWVDNKKKNNKKNKNKKWWEKFRYLDWKSYTKTKKEEK